MTAADRRPGWRAVAITGLLAGTVIAWAALPVRPGAGFRLVLIAAIAGAVGGAAQLTIPDLWISASPLASTLERASRRLAGAVRAIPWPEVLLVAVLTLEVQHPSRPWHTGLLAVAVLGYLLAIHLAETQAPVAALRPQLPLLAAGIALAALGVGAATLPVLPAGTVSSVVRAIAAVAAVSAAGLAVPAWLDRRR